RARSSCRPLIQACAILAPPANPAARDPRAPARVLPPPAMGTLHLLPPRPCSHARRLRLQNLAAFPAPTRPSACRSLAAVTPTRALAHVGTAASLSSPGIGHARCCLTLARAPRPDRSTWRRGFERKPAPRHRSRTLSTAAASAESEPPKRHCPILGPSLRRHPVPHAASTFVPNILHRPHREATSSSWSSPTPSARTQAGRFMIGTSRGPFFFIVSLGLILSWSATAKNLKQ
ncbi:hypothetical protein U9M48_005635, partial [Paspalum notatum var. saurae]